METRAHHVVIGAFIAVVIVAGVLFALWLNKSQSKDRYAPYDIVFSEAVNGLSTGGAVMYSGIRVGTIDRLRLDPNDARRVIARVHIGSDVPIKQDTTAQLRLAGVTGTAVIQLSGGMPQSPPLVARGDDDVPVIRATPSPINQLLAGGEDLLVSVNDVLSRTQQIISPDNAEQLSRILHNLEQTTSALAAQREAFGQLARQLATVSRQASETLDRTSTLVSHTDQLLDGQGRAALQSTQEAMAALAQTSEAVNQLVQENRGSVTAGAQSLSALGSTLTQTQQTLATLRGVLRRLNDNPASYLLGREQTQEFTP